MKRFLKFAVVGSLGFVVDAGLTIQLAAVLPPAFSRVFGFLIAALITFSLNRSWSFQGSTVAFWPGYRAYLLTTSVGAGINYGIYALVLVIAGTGQLEIILGVACGSVAAMFVNFFAASQIVFGPKKDKMVQ